MLRNTLRVHRAMRDLTQAELADLAGVTRRSVNAIEGGSHGAVRPSSWRCGSRALHASVEELFRLEDEPRD